MLVVTPPPVTATQAEFGHEALLWHLLGQSGCPGAIRLLSNSKSAQDAEHWLRERAGSFKTREHVRSRPFHRNLVGRGPRQLIEWLEAARCSSTQPRNHRFEVTFERAFACPPLVHVGIAGLDVSNEDNLRVRVRAVDITVDGFSIEAETWFNTRVWAVDVAWIAIGP